MSVNQLWPARRRTARGWVAAVSMVCALAMTVCGCGGADEDEEASTEESSSAAPEPSETESAEPEPEPTETETAEPEPTAEEPEVDENDPIVQCVRRTGNPGEIIAWNSYGEDDPAEAYTLGEGYQWAHGEGECVTVEEWMLRTVADLPGYCTLVGKVADNPGYPVDQIPAPRLPNPSGSAGDC